MGVWAVARARAGGSLFARERSARLAQVEGEVPEDYVNVIMDLREYDVPYYQRVCIDCDIRVGAWFLVRPKVGGVDVRRSDMVRVRRRRRRLRGWCVRLRRAGARRACRR